MAIKLYKPNPNTGEMEVIWDGNDPETPTWQEFKDQHATSTEQGEGVIYPKRDRLGYLGQFKDKPEKRSYLKEKVSEEPNIMRPMSRGITKYDFTESVEPAFMPQRNKIYRQGEVVENIVKSDLDEKIVQSLNESPLIADDPVAQVMNVDPWDDIMYDSIVWSQGDPIGGNARVQENIRDVVSEKAEKEFLNSDVDFIKEVVEGVDSTDYGLFQINDKWHGVDEQMNVWGKYVDPKKMSSLENVSYAKSLYDKYGWTKWTSYKNKSYEQYLGYSDQDYVEMGVNNSDLLRINLYFNSRGTSPENAQIAKAIMFAESRGKRNAINLNRK